MAEEIQNLRSHVFWLSACLRAQTIPKEAVTDSALLEWVRMHKGICRDAPTVWPEFPKRITGRASLPEALVRSLKGEGAA